MTHAFALSLALCLAGTHAAAASSDTLSARAISWDIGFKPATEGEWVARVSSEVAAASAAGIDVLVFPELFTWGLAPYGPKDEPPAEFIRHRVREELLPAAAAAARPDMLVVLGSYPHLEKGEKSAFNRAAVLLDGAWRFVDKLDPTQGELIGEPAIKPGYRLPVFSFRGGKAAVVVCFSLEKPEVAVELKKAGVQLVLAPSATADEDGVARVLRAASARAVELGAAVIVAPLVGALEDWKNVGSAAMYLPAQKGIDHRPQESPRRQDGIAHDDFTIPWKALQELRIQGSGAPETRPFLAPTGPFTVEGTATP
jgi:predicted amidohydrolase